MSAFAGMTKGRVDGKAGRNKNLPKEPVFVKKKQKTPHLEPPDRIHVRYGAEILATGQEEAFDTIHIAKADLNVILPPNLGALVSDIAFVKGSADGIVSKCTVKLLTCFVKMFYDRTIKFVQTIFIV